MMAHGATAKNIGSVNYAYHRYIAICLHFIVPMKRINLHARTL